jgi:alpha-tubulin suppressor-like RCC1 family protein
VPVDVIGLDSGVIGIAANKFHTCALTDSGGVKCWGSNYFGQLGNGLTDDSPVPVDVDGLRSGIVALAPGYTHTCAITLSGGVKCWGSNGVGELGDGTNAQHLTPVDVIGLDDRVISLGAGDSHTCVVLEDGSGKCWGMGPLGDGTFQSSSTPVSIINPEKDFAVIASGAFYQWGNEQYYPYTCVLTNMIRGKCWGANIFGQLGNGTVEDTYELTPGDIVNLP